MPAFYSYANVQEEITGDPHANETSEQVHLSCDTIKYTIGVIKKWTIIVVHDARLCGTS